MNKTGIGTTPAPLKNVTAVERAYLRLVRQHGTPAPASKRLALQTRVAADGETDCWTHAWQVAQQLRTLGRQATYVEGVVVRRGADGPSFHAWVEESTPLSQHGVLVECTPGYEDAGPYFGIHVDSTPGSFADRVTEGWTTRFSVIQALLSTGLEPHLLLESVSA